VNIPREYWASDIRAIVVLIRCQLEGGVGRHEGGERKELVDWQLGFTFTFSFVAKSS
jgi:hypothetical protein